MSTLPQTRILFSTIVLAVSLLFTACNPGQNQVLSTTNASLTTSTARFQWSPLDTEAPAQIKVLNSFGVPIPQAQILIGLAQGTPFKGNFIQTNASGVAQVPKEWSDRAAVTVEAPGYVRQTVLDQKPGHLTFRLQTSYLPQAAEVRGQVTQLPVVNGDQLIDFGLVTPSLYRADLLNFDLDQVLSPYIDVIKVFGQTAQLPSNVSLPSQKEKYIFNITLEKPIYRLMVPSFGPKTFYAASGRFPFKDVMDDLRAGKAFYEVLNKFTISGGSMREAQIANAQTTLDIPANELQFKSSVQVKAASALTDEVLMMLAVSDIGGSLITTDVKKVDPNQNVTLSSMAGRPVYVVSAIKKQSDFAVRASGSDHVSASLKPYVAGEKQILLPMLANPIISLHNGVYSIDLPPLPTTAGINPLATSAVISDLFETPDGDTKVTTAHHRWEILGQGWGTRIELPAWPLTNMAPSKKVEVNFIGTTSSQNIELGDGLFEAATHVSHSSVDFQ